MYYAGAALRQHRFRRLNVDIRTMLAQEKRQCCASSLGAPRNRGCSRACLHIAAIAARRTSKFCENGRGCTAKISQTFQAGAAGSASSCGR
eukprot:1198778-Pyramimonas_sp.AAC.1